MVEVALHTRTAQTVAVVGHSDRIRTVGLLDSLVTNMDLQQVVLDTLAHSPVESEVEVRRMDRMAVVEGEWPGMVVGNKDPAAAQSAGIAVGGTDIHWLDQ